MSSILNADDIKKALDAFKGKEYVCSFLVTFCHSQHHIMAFKGKTRTQQFCQKLVFGYACQDSFPPYSA